MGPTDVLDSSLRDAYFNADDVVLGVWFVVARRDNDDTGTGSVGVDADVHVGGGDEWYAMPLSKAEVERGDTKALLKSVTFTEERLSSKATRSHGDVLRRVEAGDDVVIVIVIVIVQYFLAGGAVGGNFLASMMLLLLGFGFGSISLWIVAVNTPK